MALNLKFKSVSYLENFPTATCKIVIFKFVSNNKDLAASLSPSWFKITWNSLKVPSKEAVKIKSDLNLEDIKVSEGKRAKLQAQNVSLGGLGADQSSLVLNNDIFFEPFEANDKNVDDK